MKQHVDWVRFASVVVLILILTMLYWIYSLLTPDVYVQYDPDPWPEERLQTTLLTYGYPQTVIDVMDETVQQQICDEQILFDRAQILWYGEDGNVIDRVKYVNETVGATVKEWEERQHIPEYAFCMALVTGLCYEEGSLQTVWCSINYEWNQIPFVRGSDPYKVLYDTEEIVVRDTGYRYGFWQVNRWGKKTYLALDEGAAGAAQGMARWYAGLSRTARIGAKQAAGFAMLYFLPQPTADHADIRIEYTHEPQGELAFLYDLEEERVFQTEIRVDLSAERRVYDETD